MIEILYGGNKGIRYRVINEQDGNVLIFSDHEVAIHYDMHGRIPLDKEDEFHEVHYPIMDDLSDLEFLGRCFRACKPRFCNGSYVMFEFELMEPIYLTSNSYWIVTTMDKRIMALFVLREQAMKYIHDKEIR